MNQTEFTVSRFENRNGTTSWRVAGLLHGVRVRKNFKTKAEAAAEEAALEIGELQAAAGIRAATTFLSGAQLREAEDAFRRLESRPQSLLFYLEYAFANYRTPEHEKPLAAAAKAYPVKKSEEHTRTLLSTRQLGAITYELGVLERHFRSARFRNSRRRTSRRISIAGSLRSRPTTIGGDSFRRSSSLRCKTSGSSRIPSKRPRTTESTTAAGQRSRSRLSAPPN